MYGHALLLLTLCESCGKQPYTINLEDKRLCARCGLQQMKENE